MGISDLKGKETVIQDTPFGYTMSVIGGKWKMAILYLLSAKPSIRFNEMQRQLGAVTYKVLSAQLKELEADGLVKRVEYPQIPPKVEYLLTPKGQTLLPVLEQLCEWGAQNR
ncbi:MULTISPECIES: helix-turn-helix domain-containing protein [unclassified Paenibacillus]|uniref:winged helix-turn-helix transcriptional regulator n=1 Tax=unclassified Paenibacillus TaxID=185978 RepID=UPI0003E24911|nr:MULTISPECIES: helix-turn-helix domain-containing protein [unclassified Paenibacillus]ETT39324.1 HTH-type transcriptional regulator [Paenibacillus sp. FSL R7-269]OMF96883.1 transcriptional regulator [Paenibacillus sp. FSL R7-0337]